MRILLIAGHGDGDPGAVGNGYKEADLTREVVSLIKPRLSAYADVDIADTSKNWYGYLSRGGIFDFSQYGYVLETHFNSAANITATGTEIYITTSEKTATVEGNIVKGISSLGFKNRGVKRKNWTVISKAKAQGVSSALLEICFISNSDDMIQYQLKKNEIADAIVKGITDGFKLKKAESAPWYAEAQKWAVEKGITDGTRPNDTTTRAEVWTMLKRLMEG